MSLMKWLKMQNKIIIPLIESLTNCNIYNIYIWSRLKKATTMLPFFKEETVSDTKKDIETVSTNQFLTLILI